VPQGLMTPIDASMYDDTGLPIGVL